MIAPCIHTVLFNIFPLFTQSSEQLSSCFHVNRTPKRTNFKPVKNASWFVKITLPWAPLPHLFLKCCIPRRPQVSFFPVSRGLFSLVLTSASRGSLLLEQYPDALQDHSFRQDLSRYKIMYHLFFKVSGDNQLYNLCRMYMKSYSLSTPLIMWIYNVAFSSHQPLCVSFFSETCLLCQTRRPWRLLCIFSLPDSILSWLMRSSGVINLVVCNQLSQYICQTSRHN